MADIKLNQMCSACLGTGIRTYNASPNGPLIEENPCSECGGDGKSVAPFSIESEWFDAIETKINYVYNKTDNILNKLDNIKDKVDQIWDKVK